MTTLPAIKFRALEFVNYALFAIVLGLFGQDAMADTHAAIQCSGGGSPFRLNATVKLGACQQGGAAYLCALDASGAPQDFVQIGRLGSTDILVGALLGIPPSERAPIAICHLSTFAGRNNNNEYLISQVGGWGNCSLEVKPGATIFLQGDASTQSNLGVQCRVTFKRD